MVSLYTLSVVGPIAEVPVVDLRLATHIDYADVPTPTDEPAADDSNKAATDGIQEDGDGT